LIWEIATHDFDEHGTLSSSNAEQRTLMGFDPTGTHELKPVQLHHALTIGGISRFSAVHLGH
jgi:hypothetical protein